MKIKFYHSVKKILLVTSISFFLSSCEKEVLSEELQNQPKSNLLQNSSVSAKNAKTIKWKMLTLVIKNINAKYGDNQFYKGTMNSDLVKRHVAVAKQIPAVMSQWTNGKAKASMEVKVIDDAITSLDPYGEGYWISPSNIKSILNKYAPKGKYSSITIAVDMGSIPITWGGLGYYPGPDYANGAIYSLLGLGKANTGNQLW